MEKKSSGKSKNRKKSNVELPKVRDDDVPDGVDGQDESFSDFDHDQMLADIDHLIDELSTTDEKSISPEIPENVNSFLRIIESKIKIYNSVKLGKRFGKMTLEDTFFIDVVKRLSKLKCVLSEFPEISSFNTISKVIQQAMVLMEDEFRAILRDSEVANEIITKGSDLDSGYEDDFPGYGNENVVIMKKIADLMIHSGYQYECCQAYSAIRKDGLNEQIKKFEYEKVSVEDVHKSKWASLEPDIARWVKLANHCSNVLFPAERKLGQEVFGNHLPVFTGLFVSFIRDIINSLLEFANAVANSRPKSNRLFKLLDIYESIRDLRTVIEDSNSGELKHEESCNLISELLSTSDSIGEVVVNIFDDLKTSIHNDNNKTPVQGGAVHPLTRYVMNYIKCAFDEYQKTLEHIFRQHVKPEDVESSSLSKQLFYVIDLLEANLVPKSTLYKDLSLRYIFLMNNFRYVLQIVKGTNEMKKMIGDNWCRRKSSDVRNYHKSYQRETWTKLLQWLTQEGVQVNGKPSRKILKDRFKNFNSMFDDIHKTQSAWVVSDEQLLSEIRVSITAVISPAYRSFLGRYRPQFEGGKSIDKYIKYQPEDIESMIETLFEGTEKVETQLNAFQAVSTVKQTTGAFKNLLKTYKNVGLM